MLYSFRKSLNKWKIVLWPVAVSIVASSLTFIYRSLQTTTVTRAVAHINGTPVSYKTFSSRLKQFQDHASAIRSEARARGIPAEFYLQLYGLSDPTRAALDAVIYESVQEQAIDPLWLRLHEEVVSREILKNLPSTIFDAEGNVDVAVYRQLVMQQRNLHIADFEDKREEEMKRDLFNEFVRDAAYVSKEQMRAALDESFLKKSFTLAKIEYNKVRSAITREDVSNAELESYYESNKERYRVPESRTFSYWVVSPSVAEQKVEVTEEVIRRHYEKNKNSLYRIPPRVKVRHILIAAETENARANADELYGQLVKEPSLFEKLAEENSADAETAKVGGVRDFFSRGTYDKAFEKAAFRLKRPGELAPVVKTDKGFELIQLVERIPAGERAFAEVKGEIEKTIRAKQAADWIRIHLEKIKKDAVNNHEAINEITAAASGKKEIAGALEARANTHTLDGLIIKNGFALHALDSYSFFTHDDSYVLVQLAGKEVSYIKPYKEVAKEVEADLIASKTAARVKELAGACAEAIHAGKTLSEAAQGVTGVSVTVTDFVTSDSAGKGDFKGLDALLKKAFALGDSSQVVLHFAGNDAYLVTLHGVEEKGLKDVETALAGAVPLEEKVSEESSALSQAFISTLLRNAQVDFDQKLLGASQHREEPIPYDF